MLTNYCVLAEALRLAQAYGVDARKIPQALAPDMRVRIMLAAVLPQMLAEDFAPRGFARQVLKDLEMLQGAAQRQAPGHADGVTGVDALPPSGRLGQKRAGRNGDRLAVSEAVVRRGFHVSRHTLLIVIIRASG